MHSGKAPKKESYSTPATWSELILWVCSKQKYLHSVFCFIFHTTNTVMINILMCTSYVYVNTFWIITRSGIHGFNGIYPFLNLKKQKWQIALQKRQNSFLSHLEGRRVFVNAHYDSHCVPLSKIFTNLIGQMCYLTVSFNSGWHIASFLLLGICVNCLFL